MAELKFSCPQCGQSIQCDEQWSGHQLPCPSCQAPLIIPALEPAAAPIPAPAPSPRVAPSKKAKASSFPVKKVLIATGSLAALGILYYFGLGWADTWQKHFNEKQAKEGPGMVAGEVGHIANLYKMLDKTEPENMARGSMIMHPLMKHGGPVPGMETDVAVATPDPTLKLSVVPSAWTLNVAAAQIPEGKVNGTVSGSNFVVQTVSLRPSRAMIELGFQQSDKPNDPALFVYLNAKLDDTLWGRTWTVSRETKKPGMPQVVKRSQPNPRLMAVRKPFNSGYAMQLEFGTPTNGWVPGKVFLALPDPEKSHAAGLFYIAAVPKDE